MLNYSVAEIRIKHFTIVINNTIQMNGGQYIEHMNNYQGKEDEKCLDKE